MGFLDTAAAETLTTGTVVELASGHSFTIDPDAGESYVIGSGGILTAVTVADDRLGERRCMRRYSPAAWISVTEISEPMPPGSVRKRSGVEGIDRLTV
ncbi:hypothetical protein QN239_32370 [Mycolicibacterium sp. Y3]